MRRESSLQFRGNLLDGEIDSLCSQGRHNAPLEVAGANSFEVIQIIGHIERNTMVGNPSPYSDSDTGDLFGLSAGAFDPNSCGPKSTGLKS